jgi:cytochrome c-type biogenesis protein CcmH/NrfG
MTNEPATAATSSESSPWTRVYLKAAICLVVGLAVGYLLRGSRSSASSVLPAASVAKSSVRAGAMGAREMPGGAGHMQQMANKQAAPLLERLKSDPNNSALLIQVGGIYHTTHQFKQAAEYYDKALQVDPKNVAIRTKLASSLFRMGDADGAIAQLNQALSYDPKDANALFDLGVVKLNGKQDSKGALAAWQRLLKSNPQLSADRKATVQKLMAAVMTTLSDQNGIEGAGSHDGHKSDIN